MDLGGRVGEVDDGDLVEIRLSATPVVRVSDMDALLAWSEALKLVRPSSDLRRRITVISNGNDAVVVLPQLRVNRHIRLIQVQANGAVVELLDVLRVERG